MTNKDLIIQYVDTGLLLPEEQVVQLPNWARKTYIRKRMIATSGRHILKYYEIKLLDKPTLNDYFRTIRRDHFKNLIERNPTDVTDEIITHYINAVDNISDTHFTVILEYISDENRDGFIELYLKTSISKISRFNISDIIMNATNPERFIIKLFTNEHVLSLTNYIVIDYLNTRIGIINFLNKFDNNYALKLSELMIHELAKDGRGIQGRPIKRDIIKNLFNLKFDDSIHEDMITHLIQMYKDDGVKLLIKRFTKEKIVSIFKNVEYYAGVEDLGPFGLKLARKYGSVKDTRPTFDEIYNEINNNNYYEDDKDGYIDIDYLDEPLPPWSREVGADVGYMYNDSTMDNKELYNLSKEEVMTIVKKQIPKIFNIKKS